jgi:hypothetical protein
MPNPIKYSTSAQTLALKKGNFWIGTGDVGKGPTSTTDYYKGITPPAGGYTIYLNKASGGPSIYTAANDSQLISLSNTIAGQTFATAAAALAWFATQTDKMVFNRDYESIVTNGLILNWDGGFNPSYPTTGSSIYDLSVSGSNGNLINGVGFNSSNGGSLTFDGADDRANSSSDLNTLPLGDNPRTMMYWIYPNLLTSDILIQIAGYGLDNGTGNLFCGCIGGTNISAAGKSFLWGNGINYASSHDITINTWQHIAWVKTAGNIICYKNGVADSGGSYTINTVDSRPYMGIVYSQNLYSYYNGRIGNFLIYNRALSAAEVSQNYNAQKGRFGL